MASGNFPFLLPALEFLSAPEHRRFCVWLNLPPVGGGDPIKKPFGVNGEPAKSSDPATWLTYTEALALYGQCFVSKPGDGGIGIFLGYGLGGIDLDTCITEDGLAPWAASLMDLCGGLFEVSPSGTGLKAPFWYRPDDLPAILAALGIADGARGTALWKDPAAVPGKKHPPGIEFYTGVRYFTVTGNAFSAPDAPIIQITPELAVRIAEFTAGLGGAPRASRVRTLSTSSSAPSDRPLADIFAALAYARSTDRGFARTLAGGSNTPMRDGSRSAKALNLIRYLRTFGMSESDTITFFEIDVIKTAPYPGPLDPALAFETPFITDPDIISWVQDKGFDLNARQLRRSWITCSDAHAPFPPLGPEGAPSVLTPLQKWSLTPTEDTLQENPTQPAPTTDTNAGWTRQLQRERNAGILGNAYNAILIFRNDPVFKDMFAFDEFKQAPIINKPFPTVAGEGERVGPYPRIWRDDETTLALAYMQRVWSSRFSDQVVHTAMIATAGAHRYHPIKDWIKSIKWDGEARVESWLSAVFGCPDDAYHQEIGKKWLLGAIMRLFEPGCKFEFMVVIEGPQNLGKSRALRVLAGQDAYFTDALPFDLRPEGKSAEFMNGTWLIELPEVEKYFDTDAAVMKGFVRRQFDRYRAPYARATSTYPRQCVFIGTTNRQDYCNDVTGNTRLWPVKAVKADWMLVEAIRDQLWAEALALYEEGVKPWLENEEAAAKAEFEQNYRNSEDPWVPLIHRWLVTLPTHTTTNVDILTNCLGFTKDRMSKHTEKRIADAMISAGWERYQYKDESAGFMVRGWRKRGSTATSEGTRIGGAEIITPNFAAPRDGIKV